MREGWRAGWQGELNEKRNGPSEFVRSFGHGGEKFKENCPPETRGQKVIGGGGGGKISGN